jgi:6-phospho-beta-glucosidase
VRLTILGGGGFRVPLVYGALRGEPLIEHVTLYDRDAARLGAIARVIRAQRARGGPPISVTTELGEALRGADFVFSAIRVRGLEGRVLDERIALAEGVLGQETVGAGGVSYGLRTVPVVTELARRIAEVAPEAWVVNFTNPAGLVTEAMAAHLGERVIGICDSPVGLTRRVAAALGADPGALRFGYAGLNHLGWLLSVHDGHRERLPGLLASPGLERLHEAALFGADWLRALGAVPNEYLHYYYDTREAIAAARAAGPTRGEFLREQQERCYAQLRDAADPLSTWDGMRGERDRTYMADAGSATSPRPAGTSTWRWR